MIDKHRKYEIYVGNRFRKDGWRVTSGVQYAGRQIDHIAEKRTWLFGRKIRKMVEVKDMLVGVRELSIEYAKFSDLKNKLGVSGLIVVSSLGFTKDAVKFARRYPTIELVHIEYPRRKWIWWIIMAIVVMLSLILAIMYMRQMIFLT